jgi:hypothetical protein
MHQCIHVCMNDRDAPLHAYVYQTLACLRVLNPCSYECMYVRMNHTFQRTLVVQKNTEVQRKEEEHVHWGSEICALFLLAWGLACVAGQISNLKLNLDLNPDLEQKLATWIAHIQLLLNL